MHESRTPAGLRAAAPVPHPARAAAGAVLVCLLLTVAATAAAAAGLEGTVPAPTVEGKSYILIDHRTGAVLAEKNADERVDPASLTKIMTVYAAAHALKEGLIGLDDQVIVSEKAWKMEGSRMFIEVGKPVSVNDLLEGIITQSGNDASVALAEHVSGSEEVFASVMTKHAQRLGMKNSSFSDATGLPDPGTYTTARDMAILSSALIREFPDIYARFKIKEFTYNGITQPNRNRLLFRDSTVDGIKTGHTEAAGYCLVSSALRDGMRVIAAVMGTSSDAARTEASYALLNYAYRFFETRQLYGAKDIVASPRVWGGAVEQVPLGSFEPVYVTIPRGREKELDAVAHLNEPIKAPVAEGQQLGTISVALGEDVLAEVPLVALSAVGTGSIFSRLYDEVLLLFE
jgi:D-alanyl-D-alanine carboxypeptidase (penicillin-binding protein 5/6)